MRGKVVIVTTGGTIAMVKSPGGGVVPLEGGNRLITAIEGLQEIAEVELIDFSNIPSPHMTPSRMLKLSKRVNEILRREDVKGVVVTHGTDTLEETAYFLDLTVDSEKPVVMTASMRNINELGTDGPRNVLSAVRVAASDEARGHGVLVCLNDEIHAAREVTKTYTSNVATFDSPGYGNLGIVDEDAVIFFRRSLTRSVYRVDRIEEMVYLHKTFTGDDGRVLLELPRMGYKGLVVEGFGRGNVPPKLADVLEELVVEWSMPVVLVSRCFKGRVLNVYAYKGGGADLRSRGVIFGQEVSGQKARIKLMVLMGLTNDMDRIRKEFEKMGKAREIHV
ncbi:MAG: asparaginase [Thermotogae bacterium]|nr:asparaginase [Thermotogota bacterium]